MANILDSFGMSQVNFGGIIDNVSAIGLLIGIVIFVFIFGFLIFTRGKKKKKGIFKQIQWWEEVNGRLIPVRMENAEEITIPGTSLKLFHIKSTDTWLPRFPRGVTPALFFVAITPTKELVNFTLKSISQDMKEAGLEYDHTDMRWAAENLREFVKRNYKDKSVPWWKEYSGIISTAIFIVIMTVSFLAIIYFLRGVVQDIGGISSALSTAVEKINVCSPGSGVVVSQ